MDLRQTLVLGFIAGSSIVAGLPLGRVRQPSPGLRLLLNAGAVGVLLFVLWDVLTAAWAPIDSRLVALHDKSTGLAPVLGYGVLFFAGLAVGLLSLIRFESHLAHRAHRARRPGPGAMVLGEDRRLFASVGAWSPVRRISLMIAVGIGLHNFAEGLAIGQSAARGDAALATVLVIGFGLHNATEGFGIVAPLASDTNGDGTRRRPSWPFLLGLGVLAGGPTPIGAAVGHNFTSEPVSVAFLTLAAGSILFVVIQLIGMAAKAKRTDLLAYGLLLGLVAGFVTDAFVTVGGA